MKLTKITKQIPSLIIDDKELKLGIESVYLNLVNKVGHSENIMWDDDCTKILSVNHYRGIRASFQENEDILHCSQNKKAGCTLPVDENVSSDIEDYSYNDLLEIFRKQSQKEAVLPSSVKTHDCDVLMNCSHCKGTGICPNCNDEGNMSCPTCHGSGDCKECSGDGKCSTCHGSGKCAECDGTGNCSDCDGTGEVCCPDCDGDGSITCDECDGYGEVDCGNCNGWGKVNCDDCNGSGSCQDCNGTGEFQLKSGRYVKCKACNGTGECSTCHGRGDFYCRSCNGTGKVTCSNCDGDGELTCQHCDGDGDVTCTSCHGSGKCTDCHGSGKCRDCHGNGKCYECHGTGNCTQCNGTGLVTCDECNGTMKCNSCKGTGKVECNVCNGTGYYQTYKSFNFEHKEPQEFNSSYFECWFGEIDDITEATPTSYLWNGPFYTVFCGKALNNESEMLQAMGSYHYRICEFINKHKIHEVYTNHLQYSIFVGSIPLTHIRYKVEESVHSLIIAGGNHILLYDSWPSITERIKTKVFNLFRKK